MASPYTPVSGQWKILETDSYRQLALPISQREIKAGDALWLNTYTSTNNITSWVEPALNSPSGYTTLAAATSASNPATYASTSGTLLAEQQAFAALFIGIAQAHRTPRSFNKYLNFAVPTSSSIQYDTSAPFITVVTSGIADVPFWDGSHTSIPSGYGYPVGYGVAMSGFKNASPFFVDASGITMTTSANYYYLYNNSVTMCATQNALVGRLVKDAVAGDSVLRIEFSSFLSTANAAGASGWVGQVAGVLVS